MTHPLSDEMCEQIADTTDRLFTSIEQKNMRAAADWQLEQCIEKVSQMLDVLELYGNIEKETSAELKKVFKKEMRPQEDN